MAQATIGKLYQGTPIGTTGQTEFYPITSTKAVFLDRALGAEKNVSLNTYLGNLSTAIEANATLLGTHSTTLTDFRSRIQALEVQNSGTDVVSINDIQTSEYSNPDILSVVDTWSNVLDYFPKNKYFIWRGTTGSYSTAHSSLSPGISGFVSLITNTLYRISARETYFSKVKFTHPSFPSSGEILPGTGETYLDDELPIIQYIDSHGYWNGLAPEVIQFVFNDFRAGHTTSSLWFPSLIQYGNYTIKRSTRVSPTQAVALGALTDEEMLQLLGGPTGTTAPTKGQTITFEFISLGSQITLEKSSTFTFTSMNS